MNGAHLHLALIHFPIAGVFLLIPLLAWAIYRKSEDVTRAALGFAVLVALAGVPAYLAGEEAEEVIEDMAGVSEHQIEEHEEAALPGFIVLEIMGAASLGSLLFFRGERKRPGWLIAALLVLACAGAGLLGYAGNLGGQIRHPEVRSSDSGAMPGETGESQKHTDDD